MEEIIGMVEAIIYENESNGYMVAKMKIENRLETINGAMPFLKEGMQIKATGIWTEHKKFGKQFKVQDWEEVKPKSQEGVERYLASGIINGIGPVTAHRIIKKFGDKALDIIENDINKLLEVEGIGNKKIDIIKKSFEQSKDIKDLVVMLQGYGISPKQCIRIHKVYGKDAVRNIKENPYKLIDDIRGIGFKTSDRIALSIGIDKASPFRISSGIKYVIDQFCLNGNTYMPKNLLVQQSREILGVGEEEIENGLYNAVLEQRIKNEVIQGEECVYNIPYYYCELGITKKIVHMIAGTYPKFEIDLINKIEEFEKENGISFAESQKEAIIGAFENGVEIITGGPGTGKTTIINCITNIMEDMGLDVFMAAPTGRAAKRMSESTGREAKTIHRLLELGYGEDEEELAFARNEKTPLECDVLIVDEASMIDLTLMNNLLKAVKYGMRLIIVGDVDQLPSVGAGRVLHDLIDSECIHVVRLRDIFRQSEKSMIVLNAHKINNGEMPVLNNKDKDFFFLKKNPATQALDTIIGLVSERLPKFNPTWNSIRDIQILSPMRKGILGVDNLNEQLQEILNPRENGKKEIDVRVGKFRVGDKVMQIKNNYSIKWTKFDGVNTQSGLGVYNGDVGYIDDIDENGNINVNFDDGKNVIYEDMFLDELTLAYAVTIHKSQGSEFPVVVIPMFMGPPMLMNKNLLYTGITRAKGMVVLVGEERAMKYMISNDKTYERFSALSYRIKSIFDI